VELKLLKFGMILAFISVNNIGSHKVRTHLTLILLTWKIRWAPNNASKWQMGFNLAFKGLMYLRIINTGLRTVWWNM